MRFVFLFLLFTILTACASKETEYVVKTEYKYVTYQVPKKLDSKCAATKPITPEVFSKLNSEERENYLANYTITLLGDVKKCDSKLQSVLSYIKGVNKMSEDSSKTLKEKKDGR